MSELSKVAFETKYNDGSVGLYKAGQVAGIDSSDHRSLVTDIKDSVVWPETNPSNTGPWKQQRVNWKTTEALPPYTFGTNDDGYNTLTGDDNEALEIDGVTLNLGDAGKSILVSEESTSFHNGVYEVINAGSILGPWVLTLRNDSRTAADIALAVYQVREGDTQSDTLWKQTFDETGFAISNVAYEEFQTGGGSEITDYTDFQSSGFPSGVPIGTMHRLVFSDPDDPAETIDGVDYIHNTIIYKHTSDHWLSWSANYGGES